jgi:hypothetical protein
MMCLVYWKKFRQAGNRGSSGAQEYYWIPQPALPSLISERGALLRFS